MLDGDDQPKVEQTIGVVPGQVPPHSVALTPGQPPPGMPMMPQFGQMPGLCLLCDMLGTVIVVCRNNHIREL